VVHEQEAHNEGEPFCGEGRLINSGADFDNLTSEEARRKLLHILGQRGVGGYAIPPRTYTHTVLTSLFVGCREYTNYRLRDWLISRQRYAPLCATRTSMEHL
jgi:leucyl-tRNA synthetase